MKGLGLGLLAKLVECPSQGLRISPVEDHGQILEIKSVEGSWLGLWTRPMENPRLGLGTWLVVGQSLCLRIRPVEEDPGLMLGTSLVENLD